MRALYIAVILILATIYPAAAQFDFGQGVSESGYGMIKTNLTFSYDHAFGSVPDNIKGRVSYQFINEQWLKMSVNSQCNTLWANFDESQLSRPYSPSAIGLNGEHFFGSFGFTALGFMPLLGHPVALLAIGNAEVSNHCFGRISGIAAAVYMFKTTKETQFGVGPLFLINTASEIPVIPAIMYRHRFNPKFAINVYGGIFGLEYNPTKDDLLVLGADIDVRSFYFKPNAEGLPDKCRFTMSSIRPGIKYKRRFAPNFYGTFQTGVSFKMSGRVTEATSSHRYLDFKEKPAFFLQATVSYSL